MNGQFWRLVLGSFVLFGLPVSFSQGQPRETVSLDGVWNFATDPDNRGETEKWYQPGTKLPAMPLPGYAPTANGMIRVPGIWDNQGYGTETDKVRHNFVGKGWYKRQLEIPQSWAGRRVFLAITGACRYTKVWINDQFLGENIGFLSAQEYDITKHVAPGQAATITIQVDSQQRWEVDAMYGCSLLADYLDVAWGGIWGHVTLESRSDAWLSDLYVQPDVPNSSCSASATFNGKTDLADGVKLEVLDHSGQRVADATEKLDSKIAAGQPVIAKTVLPNAKLWTPEGPTLYTARLSLLKGNQVVDAVESRFGMRQFTIDGPHVLLNGKRLMLRGYGDDHIYPEQMAMPSDKELHLARLRTIKSYGFNHVRHHSSIMPPEYYDACDEVGMISTAEFSICYSPYLPGGQVWKNHVPAGADPALALETYRRQWAAAILRYRNHPSIVSWVMGNELAYGNAAELAVQMSLRGDLRQIARLYDPARFFIDSDGLSTTFLDPKNDRDTLDYYAVQLDEFCNPLDKVVAFQPPCPKKPVISHETGNYITFSRPDLPDRFRHNIKPYWLAAGKAKLEALGLLQEGDRWAEKSERLYALCHKYNIESLRKNPYVSGYHWWLFQDYWTTSNGIVDHYFRPKSIAQEEVLKVNNEVVLLQDGLGKTYRGKDRFNVKLLASNYSSEPLRGELVWEVKAGDRSLAKQQLPLSGLPQGEVAEVGQIGFELPEAASPTRLRITAVLVAGDKRFANDWSAWLYPATIQPAAFSLPVFADKIPIEKLRDWGVKPIPAEGVLGERAVYVVTRLADPRLVGALERGACVVVLSRDDRTWKGRVVPFKTSWWKGTDFNQTNHTGTLVYDHPVTRAMAPDGWCDEGWVYLAEGAKKHLWETAPARPDIVIRALPTLELVEDSAILYEVGVGKGCLIVDGLNHRQAAGRPENDWLLARLLEHATARPQPKAKWPVPFVSAIRADAASWLSGFHRLISNAGGSSAWVTYREDSAPVFVCSQDKPGNLVLWETAAVPPDLSADHVTFVFAGGLGYWSSPESKGFLLEVNGQEVLQFDVPPRETWKNADKQVELRFTDLRHTPGGDAMGVFCLRVPKELLKLGEPCRLGVRSLGSGSGRWFALNPYPDVE